MIQDTFTLRPRYHEVDQMGYVYHANHVSYCHQARTELMRKLGIDDAKIEGLGMMMPVISFNIEYKTPARYDELITIHTRILEIPKVKFMFEFEIRNEAEKLVCKANSEVVFVDMITRKPMVTPKIVCDALAKAFAKQQVMIEN